jgi:hypothetical protein
LVKHIQKLLMTVAGLTALALGGSALAGAATKTTTTPNGTSTQSAPAFPHHGTTAHENAETAVTGDAADKAKAAAEQSVGSGSTATDVTADFTGNGYEVTVKKSDGSTVEVHLDKSFKVIQGGPGGHYDRGPGEGQGAAPGNTGAVAPLVSGGTVGA